MYTLAALEMQAPADGKLPIRLLHTAYRASRRGRITLILNGITTSSVDEALDPIVHRIRLDIPGLLYVDGQDPDAVEKARRETNWFFSAYQLPAAEDLLERLARPTRIEEISG